jgi:hypothetical protein
MLPHHAAPRALLAVATLLLAAAPAASAVSPVVKVKADVTATSLPGPGGVIPPGGSSPKLRVETSFSTNPPGAPLFTIQRAVLLFPDRAGTNGRLFPSCSARQIARFGGVVSRCPRGSKIGNGTVTAVAIQLGVTSRGTVTLFNGPHGKSVVFNIQTSVPANINESFEAPLVRQRGIYSEKLTLAVPHTLQEIISGVWVGIKDFRVTTGGAVRVHGAMRSYFAARACPTHPLRGIFDFIDSASGQTAGATVDTKVHCKLR